MTHLVLLGDSIFDNAAYVPGELPVIEQLRQALPAGDRASLLAVDGDCIQDVARQLTGLPADATHLALSVGGNDALGYGAQLQETATDLPRALEQLAAMKTEFDARYAAMLDAVLAARRPTLLCTIYDRCPLADPGWRLLAFTALSAFNDCITRQAIARGLPLLDLRLVCSEPSDYSALSPIEPSAAGGEKIARGLARVVGEHDFGRSHAAAYI